MPHFSETMKTRFNSRLILCLVCFTWLLPNLNPAQAGADANAKATARPLRIVCFGAHPDDCELQAGGTAALWSARGHKVKFVSVTNGDIGHWREAGGPLALRRSASGPPAMRQWPMSPLVTDTNLT